MNAGKSPGAYLEAGWLSASFQARRSPSARFDDPLVKCSAHEANSSMAVNGAFVFAPAFAATVMADLASLGGGG